MTWMQMHFLLCLGVEDAVWKNTLKRVLKNPKSIFEEETTVNKGTQLVDPSETTEKHTHTHSRP